MVVCSLLIPSRCHYHVLVAKCANDVSNQCIGSITRATKAQEVGFTSFNAIYYSKHYMIQGLLQHIDDKFCFHQDTQHITPY